MAKQYDVPVGGTNWLKQAYQSSGVNPQQPVLEGGGLMAAGGAMQNVGNMIGDIKGILDDQAYRDAIKDMAGEQPFSMGEDGIPVWNDAYETSYLKAAAKGPSPDKSAQWLWSLKSKFAEDVAKVKNRQTKDAESQYMRIYNKYIQTETSEDAHRLTKIAIAGMPSNGEQGAEQQADRPTLGKTLANEETIYEKKKRLDSESAVKTAGDIEARRIKVRAPQIKAKEARSTAKDKARQAGKDIEKYTKDLTNARIQDLGGEEQKKLEAPIIEALSGAHKQKLKYEWRLMVGEKGSRIEELERHPDYGEIMDYASKAYNIPRDQEALILEALVKGKYLK